MPENNVILSRTPSPDGGDIEKQLEKVLADRKEKIKMELEEKVKQDKIEAKKKMDLFNEKLKKEKKALKNYRTIIAEHEKNKAKFEDKINDHFERVIRYQTEIEKLANFSLQELIKGIELNEMLGKLRQATNEKSFFLKKELGEKFGIEVEVPDTKEAEDNIRVYLEHDLAKMRKIKKILGILEDASSEDVKEETRIEEREQELEMPETKEILCISAPGEREVREEKLQPEVQGEEKEKKVMKEREESRANPANEASSETESALKNEDEVRDPLDILKNYRKSETIEESGKISYFRYNGKIIIDGISIISCIDSGLDKVKELSQKLYQAESPRDKFFLKQNIINNQETLKYLIKRCIKKCEQESCSLPEYTADIINIQTLQEILEKLNIQNWSNEDEFRSFADHFESLSHTFYKKISSLETYMESILQAITN